MLFNKTELKLKIQAFAGGGGGVGKEGGWHTWRKKGLNQGSI